MNKEYSFFAFHWIHYENDKIKWTDDCLYYTLNNPFNVEDMKDFVRLNIIKDASATISIQNIKQISKEKFELFGGNWLN
ncbi:MAG: hypothetical protein ABIO04_12620 [Ferruginibacter sp.]